MKNNTEPVLTVAAITALVTSAIGVAVAFGIPLTSDQQSALTGFLVSAFVLAGAFVARRYVTPVTKAEAEKEAAVEAAVAEAGEPVAKPRRELVEDDETEDEFTADSV